MKKYGKIPQTFVTLFLLLLLMLDTACGMTPLAEPTPTATKMPLPTSTYTPTITNTRTATPNMLATSLAYNKPVVLRQMTALGLPTNSGDLGWYAFAIDDQTSYPEIAEFAGDLSAADFALYTHMIWEDYKQMRCSIRFRWASGAYYELDLYSFNNAPTWDITYNENNAYVNWISDKKPTQLLKPWSGETNVILLLVVGNRMKVFINGYLQAEVFDDYSRLSEGSFGVRTWGFGEGRSCKFRETWVWVYR